MCRLSDLSGSVVGSEQKPCCRPHPPLGLDGGVCTIARLERPRLRQREHCQMAMAHPRGATSPKIWPRLAGAQSSHHAERKVSRP